MTELKDAYLELSLLIARAEQRNEPTTALLIVRQIVWERMQKQ